MAQYRIMTTKHFEKIFGKLPLEDKKRIDVAKRQLKENPFTGKPLGYIFFREKRIGGNRLYYLIYQSKVVVLIVAYGNKKEQQATIDLIKASFKIYEKEVMDKI